LVYHRVEPGNVKSAVLSTINDFVCEVIHYRRIFYEVLCVISIPSPFRRWF